MMMLISRNCFAAGTFAHQKDASLATGLDSLPFCTAKQGHQSGTATAQPQPCSGSGPYNRAGQAAGEVGGTQNARGAQGLPRVQGNFRTYA